MTGERKAGDPGEALRRDEAAQKAVKRKESDTEGGRPAQREKDAVTEGSEESFPASDPPSFMGGSAISGSPPKRKSDDGDEKTDKKD